MVHRSVVHLCLLLSISGACCGQITTGYTRTSNFNQTSNLTNADCLSGGVGCWHAVTAPSETPAAIFGTNGNPVVISTSGHVFTWNEYPTGHMDRANRDGHSQERSNKRQQHLVRAYRLLLLYQQLYVRQVGHLVMDYFGTMLCATQPGPRWLPIFRCRRC